MNAHLPNLSLQRCAAMTQADAAVSAIRAIEVIDCDNLRDLFNVIASKMTAAGFSSVDMDAIDEMSGFICGEVV